MDANVIRVASVRGFKSAIHARKRTCVVEQPGDQHQGAHAGRNCSGGGHGEGGDTYAKYWMVRLGSLLKCSLSRKRSSR
jgi:hypothetical protein